jgi:hypothetical protein
MSSSPAVLPDPDVDSAADVPAWLEILPILQDSAGVWCLRPPGSESWRVRCGGPVRLAISRCLAEAGLAAAVVHSTSWREVDDAVLLTHLAVLGSGAGEAAGLERWPVRRRELARGTATWPPAEVGVDQVVEHALRHLAWLHIEDPSVSAALEPEWRRRLRLYRPEPFRMFERLPPNGPERGAAVAPRPRLCGTAPSR